MERSWAKVGGAVWVYIVRCAGGRLYTGVKDDPVRRFEEHRTADPGLPRGIRPRN